MTSTSISPNISLESNSHILTVGRKHSYCTESKNRSNKEQIIHSRGNHWIVASTLRCSKSEVQIFDSLHTSVGTDTKNVISNIFQTDEEPELIMAETSKQNGVNDCGLFAIATATALAFDLNPVKFGQSNMRAHLLKCFEGRKITPFPTELKSLVWLYTYF